MTAFFFSDESEQDNIPAISNNVRKLCKHENLYLQCLIINIDSLLCALFGNFPICYLVWFKFITMMHIFTKHITICYDMVSVTSA